MIEFRVEYKRPSETLWELDDLFENMEEAMAYMARESLIDTGYDHRIVMVKFVQAEVALVRAIEEFV